MSAFPLIERLFPGGSTLALVLKADGASTILAASADYLRLTRAGTGTVGKPMSDGFSDGTMSGGAHQTDEFRASIHRVIQGKVADRSEAKRYDLPKPAKAAGSRSATGTS